MYNDEGSSAQGQSWLGTQWLGAVIIIFCKISDIDSMIIWWQTQTHVCCVWAALADRMPHHMFTWSLWLYQLANYSFTKWDWPWVRGYLGGEWIRQRTFRHNASDGPMPNPQRWHISTGAGTDTRRGSAVSDNKSRSWEVMMSWKHKDHFTIAEDLDCTLCSGKIKDNDKKTEEGKE